MSAGTGFPDALRFAAARIRRPDRLFGAKPVDLGSVAEAIGSPADIDLPLIDADDIEALRAAGGLPDRFAIWVAGLRADMAKPCQGRQTLSLLIRVLEASGFLVEDCLADADHVSMTVSMTRSPPGEGSVTSRFVAGDKLVTLRFAAPTDIMRTKSVLTQDFYERYMLKDAARRYRGGGIVDVGANIGNHSVFFGGIVRGGMVHAIEPGQRAFALLTANLVANGLEGAVRTYRCAAGEVEGEVAIGAASPNNLGAMQVVVARGPGTETVRLATVDSLLPADETVGLVKIDVEGFEIEALRGMARLLRRDAPDLYVEAKSKDEQDRLAAELEPLGYRRVATFNDTPTHLFQVAE